MKSIVVKLFLAFLSVGIANYFYGQQRDLNTLQNECTQNNANSCVDLGAIYVFGKGVQQSPHRAHPYLQKACELEDGAGCAILGFMYEKGLSVQQNYQTARIFSKEHVILKLALHAA